MAARRKFWTARSSPSAARRKDGLVFVNWPTYAENPRHRGVLPVARGKPQHVGAAVVLPPQQSALKRHHGHSLRKCGQGRITLIDYASDRPIFRRNCVSPSATIESARPWPRGSLELPQTTQFPRKTHRYPSKGRRYGQTTTTRRGRHVNAAAKQEPFDSPWCSLCRKTKPRSPATCRAGNCFSLVPPGCPAPWRPPGSVLRTSWRPTPA